MQKRTQRSPIKISILDFLKSGTFGPIYLGIPQSELFELLGAADLSLGEWPSEVLGKYTPHPEDRPIWKYGIVEFYWDEESQQLYMIHFDGTADKLGLQESSEIIQYDPWLFGEYRPLYRERLVQGLLDVGISYRMGSGKVYGEIILPSGVVLAFDRDGEFRDQVTVITRVDEKYTDRPL